MTKEWPGDNDRTCYNAHAVNELLYLGEDSNDDANNNDTIEIQDEEVLTFWLEVPPGSGTYIESNSVMIDRAQVGVEWQRDYETYSERGELGEAEYACGGFLDNIDTASRVWCKDFNNGDLSSKEANWMGAGDNDYVDSVDLALRYGHGDQDVFENYLAFFVDKVGGVKQPEDKLYWSEILWGDKDVDWVAIWSCYFLDGDDSDLKNMADPGGVHLICGYVTEALDSNFGKYFAEHVRSETVKQAWFHTNREYNSPNTTARVFGPSRCANDCTYGLQLRDSILSDDFTHWDDTVP